MQWGSVAQLKCFIGFCLGWGLLCFLNDNSGPSQGQVTMKSCGFVFFSIGLSQTPQNKLFQSWANATVGSSHVDSSLAGSATALTHLSCFLKSPFSQKTELISRAWENRKFSHCDGKHCQDLKSYSEASDWHFTRLTLVCHHRKSEGVGLCASNNNHKIKIDQ